MKLVDIIKLLIENKDTIIAIIEFLKQIGLLNKSDGTFTISSVVEVESAAAQAEQQGLGDNAVEIIKLLLENWQTIYDIIKLFTK